MSTPAGALLLLLASIGVLLIAMYLATKLFVSEPVSLLNLGLDRSYGEFFQYMQTFWAGAMLAVLALRRREAVFAAWAIVCAFFVLDDALSIHEWSGRSLRALVPAGGSIVQHLGELSFFLVVGALLVSAVALTHRRATASAQAASALLMALFAVVIAFGVVLDIFHSLFLDYPIFEVPLTVVEDGGEILSMSVVTAFVFALAVQRHEPVLHGRLRVLAPGQRPTGEAAR